MSIDEETESNADRVFGDSLIGMDAQQLRERIGWARIDLQRCESEAHGYRQQGLTEHADMRDAIGAIWLRRLQMLQQALADLESPETDEDGDECGVIGEAAEQDEHTITSAVDGSADAA